LPPGGLRPRDPDGSGGFYQPIVILPAFAAYAHRVRCGLPTAPPAIDRAFRDTYRANSNPIIEALEVRITDTGAIELAVIIAGESAEAFVQFDPAARVLQNKTETLTTQWWVTAGALDATTAAPTLLVNGATTDLIATVRLVATPAQFPLTVGVVVTDARGGTQFATQTLQTPPSFRTLAPSNALQ